MSYEKTGFGYCPPTMSAEECQAQQSNPLSNLMSIISQAQQMIPISTTTSSSGCPAGQTRAVSTQPCQPVCSTYNCPTGREKVNFQRSYVGTAGPESMRREQALRDRGCTTAPCSYGPQPIDGSASITYCCPPQRTTVTSAPPPSTVISVSPWARPYFWIGLGCVGVGLFLVLRKR